MAQSVTLNGSSFSIPDVGENDWGQNVTDFLVAIPTSVLQLTGNQTLTGSVTFANQKGIRFSEQTGNGSNYVELVAPDAVTANVTLKLPDGVGSAGQVLSTDGTGVLSWIAAAGGGTVNTGTQGRLALYSSTGTTIDDVVTMTNAVSLAIAAHGQASVYTVPDTGAATSTFVMADGNSSLAGTRTFTGRITIDNGTTTALNITNNTTMYVDSTNARVSIGTATMLYPLYISKSSAGANVTLALENSEGANAASHARLYIVTGGASGGDPFQTYYNGVTNISVGMDNSDSDALCWTAAATLNGTNIMRLTTAGALTTASSITVTAGGLTVTAGGVTITSGVILATNGTNTDPGYAFNGDSNTGIYRIGADSIGVTCGGTLRLQIDATAIASTNTVFRCVEIGSASFPEYSFINDTNTGFRYSTTDTLALTTGGTDRVTVNTASVTSTLPFLAPDGVVDAPAYSFSGAPTTGIYRETSRISFTTAGVRRARIGSDGFSLESGTFLGVNGTNTLPTFSFAADDNTGMYGTGSGAIRFAADGSLRVQITATTVSIVAGNLMPNAAGTQNFGDASDYWGDISYKTLTDRGCIPWCDDGVELSDGRRVSDLQALCGIKKHPTRKTPTGLPRLDYATFPKHAFKAVESERDAVERDKNGDAWVTRINPVTGENEKVMAQDGVEMTMMFGVMIGAFKEVDSEINQLKKQVTDLNQRIATLEKAA